MPHLAYVLLPKQITRVSRGILKYSTVDARANELGGIIQTSSVFVIKLSSEKFFGSTTEEFTFVKILNSLDTLAS